MAQSVIPLDSLNSQYSLDVALSGTSYRLSFFWNVRGAFWTMDVTDLSDLPILMGVKLVADWDLLSNFANPLLPTGRLLCVDTSGAGTDPTDSDLGSRVILVYDDGQ